MESRRRNGLHPLDQGGYRTSGTPCSEAGEGHSEVSPWSPYMVLHAHVTPTWQMMASCGFIGTMAPENLTVCPTKHEPIFSQIRGPSEPNILSLEEVLDSQANPNNSEEVWLSLHTMAVWQVPSEDELFLEEDDRTKHGPRHGATGDTPKSPSTDSQGHFFFRKNPYTGE